MRSLKGSIFPEEDITARADTYEDGHDGMKRVDIYTASLDDRKDRPAVVMIHGGTFTGGNTTSSCTWPEDWEDPEWKGQVKLRECTALPKFATKLAQLGYVVFSIDYQLGLEGGLGGWSTVNWLWNLLILRRNNVAIEAAKDARAAVRWIKAHAEDLRIDSSKIAMMGDSAGAITTLWSNYRSEIWKDDKASQQETDTINSRVAAAISLSGLLSMKETLGGVAPDWTNSICCPESQPPLLVIHATGDKVVPYASGLKMYERAQEVGLSSTFISINGSWHIPYTELMDAAPEQTVFHFDTFKDFLSTSLKI